jgi:hypothetical protein
VLVVGFALRAHYEDDIVRVMSSDAFKNELEIFRIEANSAAQFLYSDLAVRVLASEHPRVFNRLNMAPLFWNTTLASLQESAIIALGRIFDEASPNSVGRRTAIASRSVKQLETDVHLFNLAPRCALGALREQQGARYCFVWTLRAGDAVSS